MYGLFTFSYEKLWLSFGLYFLISYLACYRKEKMLALLPSCLSHINPFTLLYNFGLCL